MKKKSTKRALLMSALSLLLCVSMLIGSTFAWFTDSVVSGSNVIKSGNLDIDVEYTLNGTNWSNLQGADDLFSKGLWEPGHTEVVALKIINKGNLALKYAANMNIVNEIKGVNQEGGEIVLSDILTVSTLAQVANADGDAAVGMAFMGENKIAYDKTAKFKTANILDENKSLNPGDAHYLIIKVDMAETVGNEANHNGTKVPSIEFGVNVVATQFTSERDSFGMDYDVNAEYPTVAGVHHNPARESVLKTKEVAIALDEDAEEGFYELKVTNEDVQTVDGKTTVSYDINLYKDGVKVASNGTTKYTVQIKLGTAAIVEKVLHNGNEVTDYVYENGFVTFETDSFSPFAVIYTPVDEWDGPADTSWYTEDAKEYELKTAEEFAGFAKLVNEEKVEFIDKTVRLTSHVDLSGQNFVPIGGVDKDAAFQGTFDGGNHTITGLTQNGWDLGYSYGQTAGMGLFGWIGDATIQNLTIDNAEISMEAVVMGVVAGYAGGDCTFKNITVTNTQIANYNWDTGGIVGQVYGTGSKFVFEDINIDKTVTISGHWGTWDVSAGGVIGRTADGVEVMMKNVNVACVLDVYNDACAAYQWFAYRYSGMLVGYTKTTAVNENGSTVATAPHVTCENVTVTYGDWMNYTYCQPSNVAPQYVRVQGGYSTDPYYSGRHWTAGVDDAGNKMVDDNHVHAEGQAHNEVLPFDQLFGGGQGVYGTATHTGVTVVYPNN